MSEEKSTQGKKSRAKGQRFETKVRQDLERMGWVVSKWMNTVDYDREGKTGKVVPAKRKYNPFLKALSIGTGFPDFVCFKRNKMIVNKNISDKYETINGAIIIPCSEEDSDNYEVIGLEVKANGYLDQIEKGMCIWLLENKIFSRILIAKNSKEKGKIEYVDFDVKYNKR